MSEAIAVVRADALTDRTINFESHFSEGYGLLVLTVLSCVGQ